MTDRQPDSFTITYETVTGTPHRSSLRLPGTRIEFEWAEGDSTND